LTNSCSRWRTRSRASPSRKSPARQNQFAGDEPADRPAAPQQRALRVERKSLVGAGGEQPRPRRDLAPQHPVGGGDQRAQRLALGGIGREAEPVEAADIGAFDPHLARPVDRCQEFAVAVEVPHQKSRAAIDKALGYPVVQRV
jgi:hypothetical protein